MIQGMKLKERKTNKKNEPEKRRFHQTKRPLSDPIFVGLTNSIILICRAVIVITIIIKILLNWQLRNKFHNYQLGTLSTSSYYQTCSMPIIRPKCSICWTKTLYHEFENLFTPVFFFHSLSLSLSLSLSHFL